MKINGIEVVKPEVFAAYGQWLARNVTENRSMANYGCPYCMTRLFSAVPPVGDVSDTLSTCPVCDGSFFKIIDNENGHPVVSVQILPAQKRG